MKILLFCNRPSGEVDASTISDHVDSFANYSSHDVTIWSSLNGLPDEKELHSFECLVVHYSISFLYERYISRETLERIRNFSGLKIVFIQDEYRRVNFCCLKLKYARVNAVFSCAPIEVARKIYQSLGPNVKIFSTLTGYVPERMLSIKAVPFKDRSIDVGYRARKCPFYLGKKGNEKYLIGENFHQQAKSEDIKIDISSKENDRLYGEHWVRFLSNCKATLGTDSGSSIVDFTGDIEYDITHFQALRPWAKFENLPQKYLETDGELEIQVISPRCFEAAALRCGLIMFHGNYSGILEPNKHYLPLERDFSNLNDILVSLKDADEMQSMIERTYADLISSGNYSYRAFISQFDSILAALIEDEKIETTTDSVKIDSPDENLLQTAKSNQSLRTSLRTMISNIFKSMPDWIRYLLMVTLLKKHYFNHLYSKNYLYLQN